jgi:5-formyltetrahydrofolate cyclo-ligase
MLTKAQLRAEIFALRETFDPAAGEALCHVALRDLEFSAGSTIAGVWPLAGEMDLRPLMRALHARGHRIVLPETTPRGEPLVFRVWTPESTMIREKFGTFRPDGPIARPDVVFVPLVAFDAAGNRLGYGGGYYDRTLDALVDCEPIGFAYAAQQVAHVPIELHDQPLPRILTEAGVIQTGPR